MTDEATEKALKRCRRAVEFLNERTDITWTFGYLGNCGHNYDDRSWYAFAVHPGRVGTHKDSIGGFPTDSLDTLATMLSGAVALTTVLNEPR